MVTTLSDGFTMSGDERGRAEGASILLDDVAENLAEEVARAAGEMTNTALAKLAGISTRTLRDILDKTTTRRFGRSTLSKLDVAFGWSSGRALHLHQSRTLDTVDDRLTMLVADVATLTQRVDVLERRPDWEVELIDACEPLSPGDRATVLALARRLRNSPKEY
jgi:hypothetical protein